MSRSVIIIDDTAYMRALIKNTLLSAGLAVMGEAENGRSTLSLYQQKRPDLVILNIVMPKSNGLDVLQQLKTWDPDAKVLICSAMGQASTIFSAIEKGADDFLVKPFEPKRLLEIVSRLLNIPIPSLK